MGKGDEMTEYEARICTDCITMSEGYWEHGMPRYNELGIAFLEFMAGKHVVTMTDDDGDILVDTFSPYPCDGCESRLAGYRYHVSVEE